MNLVNTVKKIRACENETTAQLLMEKLLDEANQRSTDMILIAGNDRDISGPDLMNQIALVLKVMDSEIVLADEIAVDNNDMFTGIELPLRQTLQVAFNALKEQGVTCDIIF